MAWQDETIAMLRPMVGDTDEAKQTYSDDSLEQLLLLAAKQVAAQLTFSHPFSASMQTGLLTPDPTLAATRDESFVNLMTLKAAAIIDRAEAGLAARRAIMVKDGSSAIDLSKVSAAKLALLVKGGWNAAYEDAKWEYQAAQSSGVAGAAIMGPFRLYAEGGFTMTSMFGGDPRNRDSFLY